MTYYVYGEITLKHQDWVEAYLQNINAFIEKHGGQVLSRTIRMEKVEGRRVLPTNVILLQFSDRESALSFFDDPEYQQLRQLRIDGATSEFILFPAEDLAVVGLA